MIVNAFFLVVMWATIMWCIYRLHVRQLKLNHWGVGDKVGFVVMSLIMAVCSYALVNTIEKHCNIVLDDIAAYLLLMVGFYQQAYREAIRAGKPRMLNYTLSIFLAGFSGITVAITIVNGIQ